MLKYTEVVTNLDFIKISTFPLDFQAGVLQDIKDSEENMFWMTWLDWVEDSTQLFWNVHMSL